MIDPFKLSELTVREIEGVIKAVLEENQFSRLDAEEHYGFIDEDRSVYYWVTDDLSEFSLQDYLDELNDL